MGGAVRRRVRSWGVVEVDETGRRRSEGTLTSICVGLGFRGSSVDSKRACRVTSSLRVDEGTPSWGSFCGVRSKSTHPRVPRLQKRHLWSEKR